MPTKTQPSPLPRTGIKHPSDREFPWGQIDRIHTFDALGITIVEFRVDKSNSMQSEYWDDHGKTRFITTSDGTASSASGHSFYRLDSALVFAIEMKRNGGNANTQAAKYFDLMTLGVIPGSEGSN